MAVVHFATSDPTATPPNRVSSHRLHDDILDESTLNLFRLKTATKQQIK